MRPDKFNSITHTKYWKYLEKSPYSNSFSSKIKKFLKYIINIFFLNYLNLRVVKKHSIHRKEQRSYSNNFDILSIRNEQIANYFLEFGLGFEINFDKIKLLKNIKRYDEIFRKVKIKDLNGGMGYNNGISVYSNLSFSTKKNFRKWCMERLFYIIN